MYLKAWAKYDHELPTGNEEQDAEPSPNLRCQFCKDLDIDTYDEDMMIFKYYNHLVDADTIAKDLHVDSQQLSKLFEAYKIENCNAVIAYHEDNLKLKKTSQPTLLKHLGQLDNPEMPAGSKTIKSHYLWIGAVKLSKAEIIKSTGLKGKEIDSLNFHYSKEKKRIDETIMLEVQDFDLAERMVLNLDHMGISPTAHAVLLLSADNSFKIDIEEISKTLGMDFIAEFATG
ncbi:hypothetical protein PBAL39_20605 [Pedobacter sp. BAL39]|nr:hypothetical protein PBAL39_20605 [Pedobacter sp. BAL39]